VIPNDVMTANIAFPGADRPGTVIAVHATAPSRLLAGSFIPPKNVKALRDVSCAIARSWWRRAAARRRFARRLSVHSGR
jgi:hypothetical protein